MIKSFKHKGLERFFWRGSTAGIQAQHAKRISMILGILDAAESVEDMDTPIFRLHPLLGGRQGIWSVRLNGNWRITFRFEGGHAEIVNYEDYH